MTFKTYLVEDNPVIRENLVGFLEDIADATVVAHASGEDEAVAWLGGHRDAWDVAIVDLFLDQGNGLGVVKACRQRRADQKVVVLSNYATPDMRARSRAMGADAFFDKSAEIDLLLDYCETLSRRND
jgi:DNA-binding NarL/FixJ family response regulator